MATAEHGRTVHCYAITARPAWGVGEGTGGMGGDAVVVAGGSQYSGGKGSGSSGGGKGKVKSNGGGVKEDLRDRATVKIIRSKLN